MIGAGTSFPASDSVNQEGGILLGIYKGIDPAAGREDVLYRGLGKAPEPLERGGTVHIQRSLSVRHEECCWETLVVNIPKTHKLETLARQ